MPQYLRLGLITLVLLTIISFTPSRAQDRGLGLGVILGEPTGFSIKGWTSSTTAIDGALAWSFSRGGALHLHADYLWHSFNVFKTRERIPVYYGVGARLKTSSNDRYHYYYDDRYYDARFGIRGVVGLDFLLRNAPLDIFLELAPIMDIVPSTDLSFNGGLGIRVWLQ